MKWPIGKYNGERIIGFRISFAIRALSPFEFFIPVIKWNYGEPYFIWLFFFVRFNVEYYSLLK